VLRPVSPLAWLPLGIALFYNAGKEALEYGALFTIAICAMWPTVLNTAVGVRAIPQDFLNVGRVLKLSRTKMLFKIMVPATLPYMFTGFRLSLGIAWLVIVAAEMLTGKTGVGAFLWNEYNNSNYGNIIFLDPDHRRHRLHARPPDVCSSNRASSRSADSSPPCRISNSATSPRVTGRTACSGRQSVH
jgi:hypothetical protein